MSVCDDLEDLSPRRRLARLKQAAASSAVLAFDAGREAERAAMVAWLRKANPAAQPFAVGVSKKEARLARFVMSIAAAAIDDCDHLAGEA